MPVQLPFRFGRLDYSTAQAYNARTIVVQDDVLFVIKNGANKAILPNRHPSSAAVQLVPLTSIVLDFGQRLVDYQTERLLSIIKALQEGKDLLPISVIAGQGGLYALQNGYHRFIACVLLGFSSIPIDQPPMQQEIQVLPQPVAAKKYVPPHLRGKQ